MSLYREGAYSVPGRVLALHQFLLQSPGLSAARADCESALMPEPVLGEGKKRLMVRKVINESMKLGLLEEEGGGLRISADLPSMLRDPKSDWAYWPVPFLKLICDSEENHDMALALAWWLSLPVLSAPGDWAAIDSDQKWRQQVTILRMNDFRYSIFASWAVYLGLAWRHDRSLIPDPTKQIQLILETEFGRRPRQYLATEFFGTLATLCPVLDGGRIRLELAGEGLHEQVTDKHLSSSLSFALVRLQEAGCLELAHSADAEATLLDQKIVAGRPELQRVSRVHWLGMKGNGA